MAVELRVNVDEVDNGLLLEFEPGIVVDGRVKEFLPAVRFVAKDMSEATEIVYNFMLERSIKQVELPDKYLGLLVGILKLTTGAHNDNSSSN